MLNISLVYIYSNISSQQNSW